MVRVNEDEPRVAGIDRTIRLMRQSPALSESHSACKRCPALERLTLANDDIGRLVAMMRQCGSNSFRQCAPMMRFLAATVAAFVSACSGVEPPKLDPVAGTGHQPATSSFGAALGSKTTSAESAAAPAVGPDMAKSIATMQKETIVGLKKDTIVLYRDPNGFEGERIVANSFALPAPARRAANPLRLEVLTAEGVRWVNRADVAVNTDAR